MRRMHLTLLKGYKCKYVPSSQVDKMHLAYCFTRHVSEEFRLKVTGKERAKFGVAQALKTFYNIIIPIRS